MALVLKTLPQATVATAGTAVQLTTGTFSNVVSIIVSAPAANTGNIYIGDSGVLATRGIEVVKGTSVTIQAPTSEMIDLNKIYANAATSGDKVNITYLQRAVG